MSTDRKVAVITGASQGISAALADAFLDRSYRVVATSRSIRPSANPDTADHPGADGGCSSPEMAAAVTEAGALDSIVAGAANAAAPA